MTANGVRPSAQTRKPGTATISVDGPEKEQYQQTQGRQAPIMMRLSMRSLLLQAVILLLGATMYLRPAAGQTVNASLGGIVSDEAGARVPGPP